MEGYNPFDSSFRIGIYKTFRNYGGPEEGGWWYNSGTLEYQSKKKFDSEEEARDYADALRNKIDQQWNDPRGVYADIGSLLGEYRWQVMCGGGEYPLRDYFPDMKPYYC